VDDAHDDDVLLAPAIVQPVGAPRPYLWSAHTPAEQAQALDELELWTGWLVHRYRLDHRTIPPCWPQHSDLIEELSALRLAWQTAYATLANGDAPLAWHEHFALARERLSLAVSRSGCRPMEHRS
jgi:hypothetical protein